MELRASLFCHVPEGLSKTDIQQELRRQHDVLAMYAVQTERTVEHCFFHVGAFDFEKPDGVLLHFLQCAQANDLGLVFVECKEVLPVSEQTRIPRVAVYFVQEGVQEVFGHETVRVEEDLRLWNVSMDWGF